MAGTRLGNDLLGTVEGSQAVTLPSKGPPGCHVSRPAAVLLTLAFVSALVATGLLVFYYCPGNQHQHNHGLDVTTRPPSWRSGGEVSAWLYRKGKQCLIPFSPSKFQKHCYGLCFIYKTKQ